MCRALRPAPYIFAGLCSLFHCYLVAATAAFLDVPLASLVPTLSRRSILPMRVLCKKSECAQSGQCSFCLGA